MMFHQKPISNSGAKPSRQTFPPHSPPYKPPKTTQHYTNHPFNIVPSLFVKIPRRNFHSHPPTTTMVIPLGPGKFYGSSLPRPRFYTDVKLNTHRVDPPVSVLDPLLSWAHEAHWSMGGLSFKRLRLQGRIEGNVTKLRAEREQTLKDQNQSHKGLTPRYSNDGRKRAAASDSPPPAPITTKRRRLMALIEEEEDEDEDEEEEEQEKVRVVRRRRLVKKLKEEFDRVASESDVDGDVVMKVVEEVNKSNSGGKKLKGGKKKMVEKVNRSDSGGKKLKGRKKGKSDGEGGSGTVSGIRTSPRLAKRGLR